MLTLSRALRPRALAMLVVVLASHVVSTSAAGRFPCTAAGGGPDQSICDNTRNSGPVTPNAPTGSQANTRLDRGSQCVEDPAYPGDFYCGGVGAQCSTRTQCDNGECEGGVCTGALGTPCTRNSQCSGNSYCYSQGSGVASGVCGGVGAQCVDSTITSSAQGPEGRYVYASKSCVSGYCNTKTRNCEPAPALGSACDPDAFAPCGAGLIVDAAGLCVLSVSAGGYICQLRPSQGARARRRRAAPTCPAHWHSCPIMTGSGAFECVNVQEDLEQCGACAGTAESVDCTAIDHAESVACVSGACEIRECEPGFALNMAQNECVAIARLSSSQQRALDVPSARARRGTRRQHRDHHHQQQQQQQHQQHGGHQRRQRAHGHETPSSQRHSAAAQTHYVGPPWREEEDEQGAGSSSSLSGSWWHTLPRFERVLNGGLTI